MKIAAFIAAAAFAGAVPAFGQTAEPNAPNIPAQEDTTLEKTLERADKDRAADRANGPVSRAALAKLGECAARRAPGEATRVLTMDFKSSVYGRALHMLGENSANCAAFRGRLKASNLLFAGEVAEAMLEKDASPLTARLAKAAAGTATPAFSFTDKIAICVVRSVPNDVASLFSTERDSAEEKARLGTLALAMNMCAKAAQANRPLAINPSGMRAMLATAAFRSLESSKVS